MSGLRRALATLGPIAAVLLLASLPLWLRSTYVQSILLLVFLYAVLGNSWNIIAGYAGYVSLGHSAFLGIGAYTVAILAQRTETSPFILAPLGGVMAGLVALLVSLVIFRTRGHAFVIVTIALLFILQTVALNWFSLTKGSDGLALPLPPWRRPFQVAPFYWYMLGLAALSTALSAWIRRSKFGMGLLAIREDEDKAATIGIHAFAYKVLAFVASVVLVGVAGGVYAWYLTFIDPMIVFNILVSVQAVLVCMLGGRGTVWGPVLGALILVPVKELAMTFFGSTQLHIVVFGAALILVVLFLPRGLIPTLADLLGRSRGMAAVPAAPGSSAPAVAADLRESAEEVVP